RSVKSAPNIARLESAARHDHYDVLVRQHTDALPASADGLEETRNRVRHPPREPVVVVVVCRKVSSDGAIDPDLREDLSALPYNVAEQQQTELRHVVRPKLQIAPATRDAMGVRGPIEVG